MHETKKGMQVYHLSLNICISGNIATEHEIDIKGNKKAPLVVQEVCIKEPPGARTRQAEQDGSQQ